MSLYKINENCCSEEDLLNSILNEGYFEDFDEPDESLFKTPSPQEYKRLDGLYDKLRRVKGSLAELAKDRPTSWLESKLIGFKRMLTKFRVRHSATKGNKEKTILQKIIYVITNIIGWINNQLIKVAKFINRSASSYDAEKRFDRERIRNIRKEIDDESNRIYNS